MVGHADTSQAGSHAKQPLQLYAISLAELSKPDATVQCDILFVFFKAVVTFYIDSLILL